MLLGIFLYNGTMFYELKNGTLVETKDAQGNFDLTQVLGNKYLEDVDSEKCVIVDTYSNRCFLISKDLLHHGVSEEVYHKMLDSDETDSNKSSEEVTFILTITYKCNMHCTYCYQQNDKTLEKKLISDETLDKILSIIAQYMEANPNKTVRLGLFGGEPLLIENEKVIDKILQFCKEHKTTVHITTNGSFLSYYLKKFIINRRFISGIYPTIDSMALNYMTRYDLDPSRNNTNETFKLLCCIKTLLHYGIHVDLGTNIDRHNHKEIWNTLDDLKKLQLLQDKNFAWTIGRVDDRLYETNFPDIMMESEILAELQSKPLPDNVHAAFLKTCYNFADKMGLKLNLREHKQTHSYCWSTSSSSNVFYVDMNLKTYRCTCTVGRSRYSLFDFSYENLTNYRPVAVTCNSYAECKDCKIGGFCGGGCQLSHQIDFKKCCTYEEEVFSHFMKTLFIQLTVPRFDLESIESFLYTRDEITIINQIGLAYSDAGQNKKAAEIYYQLLKYVRKHFKETITSIGVLPLVLYNYARVLDLCGRYEEGAALAKEGREACIQYGHYQVLPRCLEIEAECRHFMGDDEISKELYYQSYYLCKVIGYQIGLEVVKKEAKEYLNIDFMS